MILRTPHPTNIVSGIRPNFILENRFATIERDECIIIRIMSLPTIEPLPDENASLPPARRRRQRRMILPSNSSQHAAFLRELALRSVPSFDFFLFSLLAGICLAAALLLDSPALVFLAALLAPFMAPAIGISLGTITGTFRFIMQSLGSLSVGSLIVFLCGLAAGWAVHLLPQRFYQQAALHSQFTWPDFLVLALGAGFTAYLIIRSPNQKPLVTSVAIAYELYLPAGVAGFGLSSGLPGMWFNATGLLFTHLVWAALIGVVVLSLLGLRPLNATGYLLGAGYALFGLVAVALVYSAQASAPAVSALGGPGENPAGIEIQLPSVTALSEASLTPAATLSQATATITPSSTPTRTLVPTRTVTLTITPEPTPVWARINASEGNGALVRSEADYNAKVVASLLNGTLVEVLPEVVNKGSVAWVHIRMVNDEEGWVVRSLLRTATPAPGW